MTETTSRPHDVSAEQRAREDELIARVLASFDGCAEPRLKELMQELSPTCTPSSARSG